MLENTPNINENVDELLKLIKKEKDKRKGKRLRCLYLLKLGITISNRSTSKALLVTRNSIRTWLKNYSEGGLDLMLKSPPKTKGRASTIPEEAKKALIKKVKNSQRF